MSKENAELRYQLSNALEQHTSKSVGSLGSDLGSSGGSPSNRHKVIKDSHLHFTSLHSR